MCPTRCEPTNRQLLTWSFSFLRPVKRLVLLACLYLEMWTAGEITAVRVTALGIDRIKTVNLTPAAGDQDAWSWITSDQAGVAIPEPSAPWTFRFQPGPPRSPGSPAHDGDGS